jgi:hypothetical protein
MDAMGKGLGGSDKPPSLPEKFYCFFIGRFHGVEWYKNAGKKSTLPTILYQIMSAFKANQLQNDKFSCSLSLSVSHA